MTLLISGDLAAIRWDGEAETVKKAATMMAPRYNVFRFRDPLQGDVLIVAAGAHSWTVPKEHWLAVSDTGAPVVMTDKQLAAALRQVVV